MKSRNENSGGKHQPMPCGLADQVEQIPHALTAKDLAALLCVSPMTIYRLAARHAIPSYRIGDSLRFDPKAVAAYLRQALGCTAG
jgi:excisionase family DNA binding protein